MSEQENSNCGMGLDPGFGEHSPVYVGAGYDPHILDHLGVRLGGFFILSDFPMASIKNLKNTR